MSLGRRLAAEAVGTALLLAAVVGSGIMAERLAGAALATASWAAMKAGASSGRIPAKLFVAARASVTAGFANEVEAVNQ